MLCTKFWFTWPSGFRIQSFTTYRNRAYATTVGDRHSNETKYKISLIYNQSFCSTSGTSRFTIKQHKHHVRYGNRAKHQYT